MTTEVQNLFDFLSKNGLNLGGVTIAPGAEPEAVAKELHESLKRIQRGEFKVVAQIGLDPNEGVISHSRWDSDGYYHRTEVTSARRDLDIAFLSLFQQRAEELEKDRKELVKEFAKEFGEFAQKRLNVYQYDSVINNAVADVMQTADINEWDNGFWLPSNIGC